MRRLAVAAVLFAGTLAAGAVGATETQWWTSQAFADYAKAEAMGVVVRADGVLEAGPRATMFPSDSVRSAWAIAVLADGSVAVAADHGRVDRWTAAGGLKPWVKLGGGQVFALVRDGDGLLAGTGPRGAIFRISPRGDTTRVATTDERYVWALAPGTNGAIWAATGTRGRLLRIEKGRGSVVFDSEESNLVSLVSDGAGGVYAGGDSRGRIYHVSAAGVARTLFDAPEDEVRALARGADGVLWAAALSVASTDTDGEDEDQTPAPVTTPVAGGRSVVYRIAPDSAAVAWWTSPQPLVFALASTPQGLIAASGNRAGLFRIEHATAASQLLAPSQAQVTALASGADGAVWAATANPVALWRVGPARAAGGTLTSAPLDAKRFARFGHARWAGSGALALSTRSGNSETPDTTWSKWQDVSAADGGGRVQSPAARFLQWKLELGSADARLEELSVAWREENMAPRVDDLGVAPQAQGFRDGELGPRSEAVTQALPSGQKVEYSVSLPSNKPIRELPVWARGLRTLQWRGSDPNGDALRYRIEVKREDGGEWVEIGKDLEATLYTWNTNSLPDGRYRVRVTATDGVSNAVGEERTGFAVSRPFAVDNTPPAWKALSGQGARLEGAADDDSSPIVRLEVAVDDGDWRSLATDTGLADSREARFRVTLPSLAPGEHLVSVRAVDMAGNAATRAVTVQVPRGK
ncbi:MAG: hypothetical protein HZA61_07480 [Candidatus Eisenbacteria bacterium]|uniref:Fibronectin type-III domain-containing protein n=1 Tax=Eiseniibacteriota bacterium TaxID=2212470 RepID=A0A933SDJ3_UNCEI|nr:hypothetical protein [Candidatus Eisenbacteria bacterium]